MPIAILKFNLNEEKEEYEIYMKGPKYACAIDDFSQWLRTKSKYEDIDMIKLEDVRNKFYEILTEWGVND